MEGSMEKFEKPITDEEINKASELELADRLYQEIISKNNQEIKDSMDDFIGKEYFKNFIGEIEKIDEKTLEETGGIIGVNIIEMREAIKEKIPTLLSKIDDLEKKYKINMKEFNSVRDVLGNSIVSIFDRIVFVVKNIHSEDPKIRRQIDDKSSPTRKIIDIYSVGEGKMGVASYYIGKLIDDDGDEFLAMEISNSSGYLEKFHDYFVDIESGGKKTKNYPAGAKKLPYFRFFIEAEKWRSGEGDIIKNDVNFEDELNKLEEKDRSGNLIIDKDKIRSNFKSQNIGSLSQH